MKHFALSVLLLAPLPALATTVMVMSITGTRVEMLVNNSAVRSLRAGEVSPEGVKVIEIGNGAALVEIDGRRWQMRIGSATAANVTLQADARGHFIATASINGQPMRVLVDTGASAVSMNMTDAQRAGISFAGAQRVVMRTAAGPRPALLVRLASVQLGDILVGNVEATVSEHNDLPIVLLGMSFLNQVEMQRSGSTLTLTRRH
ncbi:MAG: retropepsin-like aspartic protease family protein [Burkholderiales bacterium]